MFVKRRLRPELVVISLIEFVWFVYAVTWVMDWQGEPWRWVPLSYVGYYLAWWGYFLCMRFQFPEDPDAFEIPRSWGAIGFVFGIYFAVASTVAAGAC